MPNQGTVERNSWLKLRAGVSSQSQLSSLCGCGQDKAELLLYLCEVKGTQSLERSPTIWIMRSLILCKWPSREHKSHSSVEKQHGKRCWRPMSWSWLWHQWAVCPEEVNSLLPNSGLVIRQIPSPTVPTIMTNDNFEYCAFFKGSSQSQGHKAGNISCSYFIISVTRSE
jgi:hypothetical protein